VVDSDEYEFRIRYSSMLGRAAPTPPSPQGEELPTLG